jgi:PAS domain S-box-containing protein
LQKLPKLLAEIAAGDVSSAALLSQLIEAIPQMVWVTGPEGQPEYVNERWRAFTGTDPEREPFGGLGLIHPEDREWVGEVFANALRAKRRYEMEYRMRHEDGSYRWVLAQAAPIFHPLGDATEDAQGKVVCWFGTTTDIHEHKTTENLLRRTEKLAAAGRLAATVAHEINNPLEAVSNLLYLSLHEDGLPVVSKRYLRMANEELRRVGHIVSQTLGFYREPGAPQSIDLRALVDDVLALYQRRLEARQIRVTRSVEKSVVEGVAGELRQVIANLLSNALDAMEPYGVLSIEVRSHKDEVRLSISDTGHGISMPVLQHIFEPFFTTKKDVGTGLGLWVSKGIVEKHQGRLEVMSSQRDEDHGTAFVMTLPRLGALRRSA